jgi:hypothetical protein
VVPTRRLNVRQEHLNVESHTGKGHIVTTILCDITEVTRTLREEGAFNLERIVITLQITYNGEKNVVSGMMIVYGCNTSK